MPFSMQAQRKGIQAQCRFSDLLRSQEKLKQSAFSTAVVTVIHTTLCM